MTRSRSHHRRFALIAAPALALMALTGCATGFNANVSRFQQLPVPHGETVAVVPADPRLNGSLEFAQYAALVSSKLGAVGYTAAASPASANLIVRLRYDVDNGREKVRTTGFSDPFYPSRWGWGPGYGWGYGGGYWGRPWHWGFYDPFLFGPGYPEVESYTVYSSRVEMTINRPNGERLFEGTATAQSLSNKLTYLVPKLVDALFTDFPGNSGESIQITVPPENRPNNRGAAPRPGAPPPAKAPPQRPGDTT